MKPTSPIRTNLVLLGVLAAATAMAHSQEGRHTVHPNNGVAHAGPRPQSQEHLAQWMQHHRNLSLADQQRALESEPGFKQLPPETQQRMRNRLTQLNSMSPEQRSHIIERTEMMEHLTPPQRQQVRGAMQQLGELPVDRRRLVARTFRDLREMPPAQRAAFLNSDTYRAQFSEPERNTLSGLIAIEPFLPAPRPEELPRPESMPQAPAFTSAPPR